MDNNGLNRQTLSARLNLNYQVTARNIQNNKPTIEIIVALKREFPELDLNWLLLEESEKQMILSDPVEEYKSPRGTIKKIQEMLSNLEKHFENE